MEEWSKALIDKEKDTFTNEETRDQHWRAIMRIYLLHHSLVVRAIKKRYRN